MLNFESENELKFYNLRVRNNTESAKISPSEVIFVSQFYKIQTILEPIQIHGFMTYLNLFSDKRKWWMS